jgi:hypothetical protein
MMRRAGALIWGTLFLVGLGTTVRAEPPPPSPSGPTLISSTVPNSLTTKDKLLPAPEDSFGARFEGWCDDWFNQCESWHLVGGVGVYVLQPYLHNDRAYTISISTGSSFADPPPPTPTTTDTKTKVTTTSSTTTSTTQAASGGDADHGDRHHHDEDGHHHDEDHDHEKHHGRWGDDSSCPPGLRKFFHDKDEASSSSSSQSTTTTSTQTTTTTTTDPKSTDPKSTAPAVVNGTHTVQTIRQDFGNHLDVSPLIWIGAENSEGLGIRGRWWQLWNSSNRQAINTDPTGSTVASSASPLGLSISSPGPTLSDGAGADVFFFHRDLRLAVWDLEATQTLQLGRWALMLTGGARYAHLSQDYNAFRVNTNPDLAGGLDVQQDTSVLRSGHNFDGAGPMVSMDARRPLGDSGFALYGNIRGSILFGTTHARASTESVFAGTMADGTPFNMVTSEEASAHSTSVLPVVEIEVGAEYGRPVGRFYPFLRAGLVGQTWFGAGNASSADGDLGFLGLEASLGFQF